MSERRSLEEAGFALIAIAVVAVTWWSSEQPGGTAPSPSGVDKLLHASVWAVLGGSVALGLWPRWGPRAACAIATVVGLAYGIVDETHQSFTPGRDTSWGDLVADLVGAALGSSVAAFGMAGRLVYRRADDDPA